MMPARVGAPRVSRHVIHEPAIETAHRNGNESTTPAISQACGFDCEPGASNIIGVKSAIRRPGSTSTPQAIEAAMGMPGSDE